MKIFNLLFSAICASLILPATCASGCHGMSRFQLAPASFRAFKHGISKELKSTLCEQEYGKGARLMDLEQMEGEFPVASDLQHALNPLFEENPNQVYYVVNHGVDTLTSEQDGSIEKKYVLKKEAEDASMETGVVVERVAGQVFLVLENADQAEAERAQVLCYIPKPKYVTSSVSVSKTSSNGMNMAMSMDWEDDSSSSSSLGMTFLSVLAVAAAGVAVLQAYKAKQASEQASSSFNAPSLDLGGSYRILSSNENELTQQLAPPSESELV